VRGTREEVGMWSKMGFREVEMKCFNGGLGGFRMGGIEEEFILRVRGRKKREKKDQGHFLDGLGSHIRSVTA
jgi:hypothetical protein